MLAPETYLRIFEPFLATQPLINFIYPRKHAHSTLVLVLEGNLKNT